jgi:hypothetical protein
MALAWDTLILQIAATINPVAIQMGLVGCSIAEMEIVARATATVALQMVAQVMETVQAMAALEAAAVARLATAAAQAMAALVALEMVTVRVTVVVGALAILAASVSPVTARQE